jgi:expansin (peptidoglycan-binding protein)
MTYPSIAWTAGLVGAIALGCSSSSSSGTSGGDGAGGAPFGTSVTGVATYYNADGSGACSFDASPSDLDVAAMDAAQWAGSGVCGECVAITGPKGNVTVRIVDLCPDCESGHLDLSQSAFAKIADVSAGKVSVTWQPVACGVSGNVSYHYKDGSNPYWTAIQVRNTRLPVQKLEVMKSGAYVDVARADYNYFVDTSGTGTGPVQVRITAENGAQLVDTLPAVSSNTDAPGSGQF